MLTRQRRHFDRLYTDDVDPWGYRTSWYELRRFDLLMAMLDRPNYVRCFEPGCSIGTLTTRLAARCGVVEAWDGSQEAVRLAAESTAGQHGITLRQGDVPQEWPSGQFDLVVLSDFLYYLPPVEVREVAMKTASSLALNGVVLAGHWRGTAEDFATPGGDAVHVILDDVLGPPSARYEDADQLISLWSQRLMEGELDAA